MSSRPRTREFFPRMKVRGGARRRRAGVLRPWVAFAQLTVAAMNAASAIGSMAVAWRNFEVGIARMVERERAAVERLALGECYIPLGPPTGRDLSPLVVSALDAQLSGDSSGLRECVALAQQDLGVTMLRRRIAGLEPSVQVEMVREHFEERAHRELDELLVRLTGRGTVSVRIVPDVSRFRAGSKRPAASAAEEGP